MNYTDILDKLDMIGISIDDKTGGSSFSTETNIVHQHTTNSETMYTLKVTDDYSVDFFSAQHYFECIKKTEKDLNIKLFL